MSVDLLWKEITHLLAQEQGQGPLQGVADWQQRRIQRVQLRQKVRQLEQEVQALHEQVKNLPLLPPGDTVHWAQSARAMPNVVFLEVDTTGLNEDAEIIRVTLVDGTGKVIFDRLARTTRPLSTMLTRITGVTNSELQTQGEPLTDVLGQLRTQVMGKYVLAYNLDFDRGKLREATRRLQQEDVFFLGEDVMAHAMRYFAITAYPKLEVLCQRIGSPLPEPPRQSAIDRARGQRALVHAMADVLVDQAPAQASNDEDESPF